MKRLLLVCVMMTLCLYMISVQSSFADTSYSFDQFTIMEKDGEYGILDRNGNAILPLEYYIPIDQFDLEELPEPVCIEVYLPTDGDYNIRDLDWELYYGSVKAGFFHTLKFSHCCNILLHPSKRSVDL